MLKFGLLTKQYTTWTDDKVNLTVNFYEFLSFARIYGGKYGKKIY